MISNISLNLNDWYKVPINLLECRYLMRDYKVSMIQGENLFQIKMSKIKNFNELPKNGIKVLCIVSDTLNRENQINK